MLLTEDKVLDRVLSIYLWSIEGRRPDGILSFVNENVGKDTPIKNPKTTPTKVVTMSLILSLGFLTIELRPTVPIYSISDDSDLRSIELPVQNSNP